jgi:hypothetical protein
MSIGYVIETLTYQRRQARRRAGRRFVKVRFPSRTRQGKPA